MLAVEPAFFCLDNQQTLLVKKLFAVAMPFFVLKV